MEDVYYAEFIDASEFNYAKAYVATKKRNHVQELVIHMLSRVYADAIRGHSNDVENAETLLQIIKNRDKLAKKPIYSIIQYNKYIVQVNQLLTTLNNRDLRIHKNYLDELVNILKTNPNFSMEFWTPPMECMKDILSAAPLRRRRSNICR